MSDGTVIIVKLNNYMKTLREYIDLIESEDIFKPADPKPFNPKTDMNLGEEGLEEVSRRDFLKGAGAAALGAVIPTNAESQTIGGGDEEAKISATKAGNTFLQLSKKAQRSVAQRVSNTIYDRVKQYYNFGGQQVSKVSELALEQAIKAVSSDFQAIYNQANKDKEETSLAGTYLKNRIGNRFGVDAGGHEAQLKMIGSLERFNLDPVADKFIKVYTNVLQQALDHFKKQKK